MGEQTLSVNGGYSLQTKMRSGEGGRGRCKLSGEKPRGAGLPEDRS